VVVLEARQDEGPDFVTVVEAGLLAKTGMNSSGLGLVTNALVTDADTGTTRHPLPSGAAGDPRLRDRVRRPAAAAVGERSSAPTTSSPTATAALVDVEAAPGDFSRCSCCSRQDGVVLHSNHFLSPRFDGKDVSVWVMPDSPLRLQRVRAGLGGRDCLPTLDTFRALLADHANYPSGVCCHPDPRMDPYDQGRRSPRC
jgi:isopenicillin-N N-acyltransferase-like protein